MKPEFKNKPPIAPKFPAHHECNFSMVNNMLMVNVDHILMVNAFAWHFKYFANINGMWYQNEDGELKNAWKHDIRYDGKLYHPNGKLCWYLDYSAYITLCAHYRLAGNKPPERFIKLGLV